MLERYRSYFKIDPEYFPAVNEKVIKANPDMWKKFFPHETFVKLLKTTVNVIDRKQRLSIWVEGSYGTGKSHAVLTLKKLLDASNEDTREYFEKYNLDNDLLNNFLRIKNKEERILTVHRYGSSDIHGDSDLVFAIQESIEHAFETAEIENKGKDSLKGAIINYLSDPANKRSFSVYVEDTYSDLFGGDTVDDIIENLQTYKGTPLQKLMDKISKVARERGIRAFQMDAGELVDWIQETIEANNLEAIVFIWDEFTEYFKNNARNLTGFQEICELSETKPFYFILVTHTSSSLFHKCDKDFTKINGRFVNPHCEISLPENIAFQLMGAAMEKSDDTVILDDWNHVVKDLAYSTKNSREAVSESAHIKEQEMLDILPIHPYAALLLKHISAIYDSNQRSMFDFIKNDRGDDIKGFQWFIDNYGPAGGPNGEENPLLTIDMLWSFFYDKGKDNLTQGVRNVLDYFVRTRNSGLDRDEKCILKAVLLLQAVSQQAGDSVELFIPNEKNIDLAFEGSDIENDASRIAEKLCRDKILFKRQLGGGKFQYNAYINEISEEELEKYKKNIDDKKNTISIITEQLNDGTTVSDAVAFEKGALKLRYKCEYASANTFNKKVSDFKHFSEESVNQIPAIICFAKDEQESIVLSKKIREALESDNFDVVFIDATINQLGYDGYTQYRDEMAQSLYQTGKDGELEKQHARNAKEALKKWKERIANGEFIIYTNEHPDGERVISKDYLENVLLKIDRERFPDCLEGAYNNVLPTMYTPDSLKLGVECGVNRKTRQRYSSGNVKTKLETALGEAWDDPKYWENSPNLLVSKIKIAVDNEIKENFEKSGRVSIKSVWNLLKNYPYGFRPCNLSAFILGFVLKEYTDGSYTWSDGLRNEPLDLDKLKEMIDEIIKLDITTNLKYKDKYIVTLTPEEKAFNESTAEAFGIQPNLCTSIEQTRERIRNKMKEYSFPIWTLKELISSRNFETDSDVLSDLIDNYMGIANNSNAKGSRSDNDIANDIGRIYINNKTAAQDLKTLLTKENCTEGMKKYLERFDDGELPKLANKISDGGKYINIVRSKFDADAANWLWSIDTANQKIREVILEYRIIAESNKIISKNTTYSGTIREWCDKCDYIRISYQAAKNEIGSIKPFLEELYNIKRAGKLTDENQKQKFLDLLIEHGTGFNQFYNHQTDIFKSVCAFYLNGFSDDEIDEVYRQIPTAGTFLTDKSTYMNTVDRCAGNFRNSLGFTQLHKFWQGKTHSSSPREWSQKHKMPILCLVPDSEITEARSAFATLNSSHPDAISVEKTREYLENATFYSVLDNKEETDKIFTKSIIKNYSVMLNNVDEVKDYLESRISADPYDWFGLPEVDKKLKQLAEAKYNQSGSARALEKIDEMDVDEVKRYLKELIKDNMTVGIEIIKGN